MSSLDLLSEFLQSPSPQKALTDALEFTYSNADSNTAQGLVRVMKQTIKQRKAPPSVKLRALQAMAAALATNNPFFRLVIAKKVLSRLIKIARTRGDLRHEARGALLFGEQAIAAERKASVDFLTLLMRSIRTWATDFGKQPDCGNFSRVYHLLLREKLQFPRDTKVQLDQCLSAVQTLDRLLTTALPDPAEISKALEVLQQQAKSIDLEIKESLVQKKDVKQLSEVADTVQQTLQRYRDWAKKSAHSPAPVASDMRVDISRVPRSQQEMPQLMEPRGLPEPEKCDSENEFGFDFESDIHSENQPRKLKFQWDDDAVLPIQPEEVDLKNELESAKAQAAYLHEKVAEYMQCMDTQERLLAKKEAEIMEAQRSFSTLSMEKESLSSQVADLQSKIAACEKEIETCKETLQAKNADESKRAQQYESQLQQARQEIATRQQQLDALLKEKEELTQEIAGLETKDQELNAKLAESQALEAKIATLQSVAKELAEVREETMRREKEIRTREDQANEGRKLEGEVEQLKAQVDSTERENAGLQEQADAVQKQVEELEAALKATLQEVETVRSTQAEAELKLTRAENAKRTAENIAARMSLNPADAIPAKAVTEVPHTISLSKTMAVPTYPKVAAPDSDEEVDNVSEEAKSEMVCNDAGYLKGLFLSQGLLYSCDSMQLGFQRKDFTLEITLCNSGQFPLEHISLDVVDSPSGNCQLGLEILQRDKASPAELEAAGRVTIAYDLACSKTFPAPAKLDLTFTQQKRKMRLLLKLPIAILHFCEPFLNQTESLAEQWSDLSPFETVRSFRGLRPFLRSMKDVAALLSTAGQLLVISPHETAWLGERSLLASGRVLSRELLVKVQLNSSATGGSVCVRAAAIRVRECAVTHLLQLLVPI